MKRIITLLLLVGLSLSAFSTLVTFKVDMRGSGVEYDTIFIVGVHTEWLFVMMDPDDAADSIFTKTFNLDAGDSTAFYFIRQGNWDNYLDYRETILPDSCSGSIEAAGWAGDRGIIVPAENTTYAYIWGTCDVPPEYNAIWETNYNQKLFDTYPNPASESITISSESILRNSMVELFDLSGKIVRSYVIQGSESTHQLDLGDISSGIYIIRLSDAESTGYRKIIIE